MSRSQVLSIYKRILRVGQNWVATHPDNTQVIHKNGSFSTTMLGALLLAKCFLKSLTCNLYQFQTERNYIIEEAKTLFRKNAKITNTHEANERYREVEARLAMAEHYR